MSADYQKAVNSLTVRTEKLYRLARLTEWGIKSQHVSKNSLTVSTTAIAAMAAEVDGVAYYVGLFVYKGALLRDAHDSTFEVVDPLQLGEDTLKAIAEQVAIKTTKLGKRPRVASPAA